MKRLFMFLLMLTVAGALSAHMQYSTSDSIQNRDRANGFFNSTDLNGWFGLRQKEVDYSRYFFGLTTAPSQSRPLVKV